MGRVNQISKYIYEKELSKADFDQIKRAQDKFHNKDRIITCPMGQFG